MAKKIELEVVTKTDTSQLSSLKDEIEEVKQAGKETGEEISESLNEVGSSADEATDSVEDLSDSTSNIDGSNIDETASSTEELGDSAEDAASSVDNLGDSTENITSNNVDDAASSIDDLGTSAENAVSSVDGLSESINTIEAAGLMSIASEIGSYGESAENMAQGMNTAAISVGQLATNVGMAEPQMVSLINHISNATFPQEEAMQYVRVLNQMGVSAGQLGDAATNMDRINDATGMGADKVMLLTQGLQSMGITADRLPESFNAIAYAEANVGGGAETLQQVLKRQAGALNEYGMDVDSTVVALSALQRETGLTGMKLGSEFGKRLKDCNGNLQELEQSLGLQAGALSNAGAATKEYEGKLQELANEEAEHKTFMDQLSAAWEDISLSLSPVISPLASFVGLIGQIGQFAFAINSIATLASSLKNISMIGSALSGLSGIVTSVGGAFSSLFGILLANPIILVVVAIVALIAALIYLYYTNEDVRNAIDGFLSWIGGAWDTAVSSVMGTIEWLQSGWQSLTDGFNQVVDFFQTYAPLVAEALFVMSTGGIGAIFLLLADMNGMPNQIGGILHSVIDNIISFAGNMINSFVQGASDAVNGFLNEISKAPGEFASELQEMVNKALDFAANLPGILWQAGVDAVTGFLDGLGRHSPGTMQTEMVAELEETANRIPGLVDLIGANLGLIAGKTDEFITQISDKVNSGVPATEAVITTSMDWIANGASQLITAMGGDGDQFLTIWASMRDGTVNAVNGLVTNIASMPSRVMGYLNGVISNVNGFASNFVSKIGSSATNAVSSFSKGISNLSKGLVDEFNEIVTNISNFAGNAGQMLYNLGLSFVNNFLNGLGRHSPGTIQREMIAELTETAKRIPLVDSLMSSNIMNLAKSVVNAWNTPELSFNLVEPDFEDITVKCVLDTSNIENLKLFYEIPKNEELNIHEEPSNLFYNIEDLLKQIIDKLNPQGHGGDTFNFNLYGDIDNEERMQKFIEAVRRELYWNNETAGRNIEQKYNLI